MDKSDQCVLWGVLSGIGIAAAATTLVVATGGTALIAGGIGLGAAISGEINVISQACNDEKEFDGADFITNVAIGGATGVVSAGAGGAASGIASKLALEGGKKLVTQAACQAVGGAISGASGTIAQKVVKGEEVKVKDVGVAALGGMISGSAGTFIGGATNAASKQLGSKAAKIAVGVAGGAVAGSATSGGAKIISNIAND